MKFDIRIFENLIFEYSFFSKSLNEYIQYSYSVQIDSTNIFDIRIWPKLARRIYSYSVQNFIFVLHWVDTLRPSTMLSELCGFVSGAVEPYWEVPSYRQEVGSELELSFSAFDFPTLFLLRTFVRIKNYHWSLWIWFLNHWFWHFCCWGSFHLMKISFF